MLLQNFFRIVHGTERSSTSLDDGLRSALLCLKANESANTDASGDRLELIAEARQKRRTCERRTALKRRTASVDRL